MNQFIITLFCLLSSIDISNTHPTTPSTSDVDITKRATCHDYVIISSRGTTEPQGPSLGFTNTIKYTLGNVTNGIEYDTKYPADASISSSDVGATDVIAYITNGLRTCPDQRYALLGYSQGATVTLKAIKNFTDTNNNQAEAAIKAIWMIGNPIQKPGQPVTFDEKGGSTTRNGRGSLYNEQLALSQHWVDSGKVKEICYTNDPVCLSNNPLTVVTTGAHFAYIFDQNVQNMGAQWLISRLKR